VQSDRPGLLGSIGKEKDVDCKSGRLREKGDTELNRMPTQRSGHPCRYKKRKRWRERGAKIDGQYHQGPSRAKMGGHAAWKKTPNTWNAVAEKKTGDDPC